MCPFLAQKLRWTAAPYVGTGSTFSSLLRNSAAPNKVKRHIDRKLMVAFSKLMKMSVLKHIRLFGGENAKLQNFRQNFSFLV